MCGVIGYVGTDASPQTFFQGLKRLEYRGYDSAGIAMLTAQNDVKIVRAEGKLINLEKKLSDLPAFTHAGIGHTRWATHGKPTEINAHPHRSGQIVMLHNGIIENYKPLKEELIRLGYKFQSETDTEVATHLLNHLYGQEPQSATADQRMRAALMKLVKQVHGAFAFGILCLDTPDTIYVVKLGSPMVLGLGENANYFASGINAVVDHTRQVIVLEDYEIAFLKKSGAEIVTFDGKPVVRKPMRVDWSAAQMEKGGYRHFMLKEIHEHPQAVSNAIVNRMDREQGRVHLETLGLDKIDLKSIERIQIIACGSSHYASHVARYAIEQFSKTPVELELGSEYRSRAVTCNGKTLVIAVSQSGETSDTLQSIKFAKEHGAQILAVVNVPGSSIAHVAHAEALIQAGPEVGVASTKALTAQISTLLMVGLALAQAKGTLSAQQISDAFEQIVKVPALLEKGLGQSAHIEKMANKYHSVTNMLYIGRGVQWPVALEGALKLKELSYIHAEAYAGGELKHGPIALIDEDMTVLAIAPKDGHYEKMISNVEEIRARGGRIIGVGTEGDTNFASICEDFIAVPECPPLALPFVTMLPVQLFSYWMAVRKGTDVDQPRNLAKSVTVE